MLCGLSLFFLSQHCSFAFTAIASDAHYFSKCDVISSEEEESKDEKFKSTLPFHIFSQYLNPTNKGDSINVSIAIFLKQIIILHFNIRSPPVFSS